MESEPTSNTDSVADDSPEDPENTNLDAVHTDQPASDATRSVDSEAETVQLFALLAKLVFAIGFSTGVLLITTTGLFWVGIGVLLVSGGAFIIFIINFALVKANDASDGMLFSSFG